MIWKLDSTERLRQQYWSMFSFYFVHFWFFCPSELWEALCALGPHASQFSIPYLRRGGMWEGVASFLDATVIGYRGAPLFQFFFLMVTSVAYEVSWARNQIWAKSCSCDVMPQLQQCQILNPVHHSRDSQCSNFFDKLCETRKGLTSSWIIFRVNKSHDFSGLQYKNFPLFVLNKVTDLEKTIRRGFRRLECWSQGCHLISLCFYHQFFFGIYTGIHLHWCEMA